MMLRSDSCFTEIMATMGPSLGTVEQAIEAINSGVRNFRIHMGIRKDRCVGFFINARKAQETLGKHVDILVDLPTAKPRAGQMLQIKPEIGKVYCIKAEEETGERDTITIKGLRRIIGKLRIGQRIVFSDGKNVFRITGVMEDGLKAESVFSVDDIIPGISSCVFPDSEVSFDLFGQGDLEMMESFRNNGLRPEWVALSFADDPERIKELRRVVSSLWDEKVKIMAKIETKKGVENIDKVIECTDGIMVARGDLLAFIEPYMLPHIQSILVRKARNAGKTSIVATQMLEQFAETGLVTRPELSDIALAVRQQASAVMLSVESSNCPRAIECIRLMKQIIAYEERQLCDGKETNDAG